MSMPAQEGFIPFRRYKAWYRVVGNHEATGKLPLLCLHGGPGVPHDYLEPLEAIAAMGRRVIFYDQLGCGNSDQPRDPSLWDVALFVEELGVMRCAMGLDRVHLLAVMGRYVGHAICFDPARRVSQPDRRQFACQYAPMGYRGKPPACGIAARCPRNPAAARAGRDDG